MCRTGVYYSSSMGFQPGISFLKGWAGKTCVLILLGFAVKDFVFKLTLCASDASAKIVENPCFPHFQLDRIILTIGMILILGGVSLNGFGEAVRISVQKNLGWKILESSKAADSQMFTSATLDCIFTTANLPLTQSL